MTLEFKLQDHNQYLHSMASWRLRNFYLEHFRIQLLSKVIFQWMFKNWSTCKRRNFFSNVIFSTLLQSQNGITCRAILNPKFKGSFDELDGSFSRVFHRQPDSLKPADAKDAIVFHAYTFRHSGYTFFRCSLYHSPALHQLRIFMRTPNREKNGTSNFLHVRSRCICWKRRKQRFDNKPTLGRLLRPTVINTTNNPFLFKLICFV